MILSKSARYALRAALCLAEEPAGKSVTVDEIANALQAPRNYLSKILHTLARSGVLESTPGPGGGFRLAQPAGELTLTDIARHFDDLPSEQTCLLGQDRCSDIDPCLAHTRWSAVRVAITDFLDDTRLADLARNPGTGARTPAAD